MPDATHGPRRTPYRPEPEARANRAYRICPPRRQKLAADSASGGLAVSGFERQRMLSALILLVIALFVAGAYPPAARWRRELRLGAIVAFCVAVVWALLEIGLWWMARAR
jgi:hypothetical protein